MVDPETFKHYPEIVYALNGQVYEQGIFLQYTLAKMMSEHGIESCLLGECADQICEYSAYHKISVMNIAVLVLHLFGQKLYWKYPYQFGAYIILKKSGLMMRHFNIDSRYPYIRNPFMDNQFSVVNFFSLKKRIHKEYVSETINPNIAARLRKRGGNTSILAVIQDSMVGGMENIVQNSRWYDSKSVINKKLHLEYLLRVLYVEIFERILHWDITGGYPTLEDLLPELSK